MSVRATINGEVWEFDTPSEAAEFRRQMTAPTPVQPEPARTRKRGRPKRSGVALRTASRVVAAASSPSGRDARHLSDSSRKVLTAIQRSPQGLLGDDFAQAIGAASVAGIPIRMMVLRKELKNMGAEASNVIQVETIYVKGRKRTVYRPGPHIGDVLRLNGDLFAGR